MQTVGRFVVLGACVALTTQARAQSALPLKHAPARTQTAITPADLMTRLYLYSDDSMMGRLAGSEYNLKATAYIASEVKRFGLQPAGDSGGYFQNVPLVKRGLEAGSVFSVEGTTFKPWKSSCRAIPAGRRARSMAPSRLWRGLARQRDDQSERGGREIPRDRRPHGTECAAGAANQSWRHARAVPRRGGHRGGRAGNLPAAGNRLLPAAANDPP